MQTSNFLSKYEPLACPICGKDILTDPKRSNVIFAYDRLENQEDDKELIRGFFWACKGECDRSLEQRLYDSHKLLTKWEDVSDLMIPTKYVKWMMAILNGLQSGRDQWDDEAFGNFKTFMIGLSQLVLRQQTDAEWARINVLNDMPPYL